MRRDGYRGMRELLNLPPHHSTAAIMAEVDDIYDEHPTAMVKISDCDRAVNLYFTTGDTVAERENDLHKVDVMIEALKRFRAGLVAMHRYRDKR